MVVLINAPVPFIEIRVRLCSTRPSTSQIAHCTTDSNFTRARDNVGEEGGREGVESGEIAEESGEEGSFD
jgi:hypothetical protein